VIFEILVVVGAKIAVAFGAFKAGFGSGRRERRVLGFHRKRKATPREKSPDVATAFKYSWREWFCFTNSPIPARKIRKF
jgi:hypothetical protein